MVMDSGYEAGGSSGVQCSSRAPTQGGFLSRSLGHINTLRPFFERTWRPLARPATEIFRAEVLDVHLGPLGVSGRLLRRDPARLVVVIHGLGGSVDSGYMGLALRAADEAGVSALLLNCRGCDGKTGDIYHSGLTDDLAAAIASPDFKDTREIALLGYSVGGHIALCYGCRQPDPRVSRIAAICSPLDLKTTARDFDAQRFNVYRGHVMDGLKDIYTAAYQRNPRGILPEEARRIRRIRKWDDKIVAPRFGFQSGEHYYESQSVGFRLGNLKTEALYVGASFDPMVHMKSVVPFLGHAKLEVAWDDRAGHLGFGPGFTLERPAPLGLESQVLSWLLR